MTLIELLDAAKAKTGSDPKTAEAIGIDKGYLSRVRSGKQKLNGSQAIALGKAAGIKAELAITIVMEARAKSEEERSAWQRLQKAAGIMAILLAVTIAFKPEDAIASTTKYGVIEESAPNIHYE